MKAMRYILSLLIIMVVCQSMKAEDYYFKKYDVTMYVHQNNSYSVSEKMDAFFTAPHHGIVREWTTAAYLKRRLPGKDGKPVWKLMEYWPQIGNIEVSENYMEDTESSFALQIGSEDTLVEGDHHYQIDYEYFVGDDRTTVDDVFFFSLLGSNFENNTEEFTFAIHFGKKVPQAYLKQLKLFYGEEGDKTDKSVSGLTLISDTLITGRVTNLRPYEAVTVYMPLPEGYFTCAKSFDEQSETTSFWWILGVASLIVVIVLIRETKSRNNFTKVIEYWPPKNLSSADLGYIYDTSVDPCDIISLIPYFAHKGLLTIDTTSGHPVLTKVKDISKDAPVYQQKLFGAFFGTSDTFDSKNPPKNFAERWLEMDDAIKKANQGTPNEYSWLFMIMYSLATVAVIWNLFTCDITGLSTLGMYGLGIFGSMAYIGLTSLFVWDDTMFRKRSRRILIFTWILDIAFQIWLISCMQNDSEVYLFSGMEYGIAIAYVLFLMGSLFQMRLSRMGWQRLEYIGHILGLKEFIEKSEKPLLDSLIKEHESYFYDILPYAVAFGLSEKWAKQFEGLDIKQPSWYTGNDMTMLGMCHYMNASTLYSPAMQQSVHHLQNEQAKASASSHGGGGFSGGGFGGGGCHSW